MKENYWIILFNYIDWSWLHRGIKNLSLFYFPAVLCGGKVQAEGWLSSPGYPQNIYSNMDCVWDIEAPLGHMVFLTVIDLNYYHYYYYSYSRCYSGWLAAGYTQTSQRDITMCRYSDVGRTIMSPSNTMRVFYYTGSYYRMRCFNVTLSSQGEAFILCSWWKWHSLILMTGETRYSPQILLYTLLLTLMKYYFQFFVDCVECFCFS